MPLISGYFVAFDTVEVVNRLKKEYAHEIVKNYSVNYDKIMIYDKVN